MGRISRSYPKGKLKLRAPKKALPDEDEQASLGDYVDACRETMKEVVC